MKVKKVKGFLVFLILLIFIVQSASAILHQGSTTYNESWDDGFLRGMIMFAVYDDRTEFENAFGLTAPGDGQYVYAYRILNDQPNSDEAVAYFAINGLTEQNTSGLGSQDDGTGGIEPASSYLSGGDGIWEWENGSLIELGDHSWLLTYSSPYTWKAGTFEIRGAEEDFPVPDVPEPSMMTILALGSYFVYARRNRVKK